VCTPVTIDGHPANALVDTGARAGNGKRIYVDENFAREIGLEILEENSSFSRGGKVDSTCGIAKGTLANGPHTYKEMMFVIISSLGYPVILGRNVHALMGFRLVGLPVKMPGEETSQEQMELPTEETEILPRQSLENLPQSIQEALRENANIDPLSHCTHPLAVLDFRAKEEITYFNDRHYVKLGQFTAVDTTVKEWCEAGVIRRLEKDIYPKICIPIFTVPKKEADGTIYS
jgi:hypothetical protein